MALQWLDPAIQSQKAKKSAVGITPPAFSKHDLVFVLGMFRNETTTDTSSNLCEVINHGYRLQQREYVYFCRAIDSLSSVQQSTTTTTTTTTKATTTVVLCKAKYLRKPKYRAGTVLRVRDLDDRVNGVGVICDWKVSIECLDLVHGKCVYWIRIPGVGKRRGNLLLDVEEAQLEKMVAAVAKKRRSK